MEGTFTLEELMTMEFLPPADEGYVYIMEGNGHYKIGCSKDPWARLEQLSIALPFKIELVDYTFSDDYRKAEGLVHRFFFHKRLRGEWFNLTVEDLWRVKEIVKANDPGNKVEDPPE